jgi:hypothetical protein
MKFKVGSSVLITTMARVDAIGSVRRVTERGYEVRLPNWLADGVHLDTFARGDELAPAKQRAKKCRC